MVHISDIIQIYMFLGGYIMQRRDNQNGGYNGNMSQDTWQNGNSNVGNIDLFENYNRQNANNNGMYQQHTYNNSFQQNRYPMVLYQNYGKVGNQNNVPRCPYCGCTDLYYDTVHRKTDAGSFLKTFFIIGLILTIFTAGLFLFFMLMIGLIIAIPCLIIVAIVKRAMNEHEGALHITCKRCGRRIK